MYENLRFKGRSAEQMERFGITEEIVREVLLGYPKQPDEMVPDLFCCVGPMHRDMTISVRFAEAEDGTDILRVVVLERM